MSWPGHSHLINMKTTPAAKCSAQTPALAFSSDTLPCVPGFQHEREKPRHPSEVREKVTSWCKGRCLHPSCPWATLPRGRRRRDGTGRAPGTAEPGRASLPLPIPHLKGQPRVRRDHIIEQLHDRAAHRGAVPCRSAAQRGRRERGGPSAAAGRPRPRLPRLARPRRAPALVRGEPGGGQAPEEGAREADSAEHSSMFSREHGSPAGSASDLRATGPFIRLPSIFPTLPPPFT